MQTENMMNNDAEMIKSLNVLVKFNEGKFKTPKQAKFLTRCMDRNAFQGDEEMFGVKIHPNAKYRVVLTVMTQWCDYGSASVVPVRWYFTADDTGILQQFKLGNKGNLKIGSTVDPTKTTLLWTALDIDSREKIEEPKPVEINPGNFLGLEGDKITFMGTVTKIHRFDRQKFHYYDSGIGYVTTLKTDAGDTVVYYGLLKSNGQEITEPGPTVAVKATVKATSEYKGINQTVIQRPKVI